MQNSAGKKRNGMIDVIKFISCLFIVMFHFNIYTETKEYFSGGKFGVEVFCMIAGVFFFQKYLKRENTITVWEYVKQRFLRFFPYTTAAFLLLYIYTFITGNSHSLGRILGSFSKYIWEILLVSMSGMNTGGAMLNSPMWTISCLLIVECAILGLLICSKKCFFNLILPMSLVIIYGIWANAEGVNYRKWMYVVNFGVLQVWCAEVFGILAVLVALRLSKLKRPSKVLTVIELVSYFTVFAIMLKWSDFYWGVVLTLISFIAISITISQKSYTAEWIHDSKLTRLLGKLSLAIYLNHSLFLKVFKNFLGAEKMFDLWYVFLAALLIFSFGFDAIMDRVIIGGRNMALKIQKHYDMADR